MDERTQAAIAKHEQYILDTQRRCVVCGSTATTRRKVGTEYPVGLCTYHAHVCTQHLMDPCRFCDGGEVA